MGQKSTIIDMTGQRFGKLTVIGDSGERKNEQVCWTCICECGNTSTVRGANLRRGKAKSCGCQKVFFEKGKKNKNHRFSNSHGLHGTPIYNCWKAMMQRCTNPKHPAWEHYGGRGISVCERWLDVKHFVEDMEPRPEGHSLDRIDTNGNYEPSNVRWATPTEQQNNRRCSRKIIVNGDSLTLKEAAKLTGIAYDTLKGRIARGLSDAEALAPVGSYY